MKAKFFIVELWFFSWNCDLYEIKLKTIQLNIIITFNKYLIVSEIRLYKLHVHIYTRIRQALPEGFHLQTCCQFQGLTSYCPRCFTFISHFNIDTNSSCPVLFSPTQHWKSLVLDLPAKVVSIDAFVVKDTHLQVNVFRFLFSLVNFQIVMSITCTIYFCVRIVAAPIQFSTTFMMRYLH